MERKLLLIFALTFLVIIIFQPLLKKYGPQPPPAKPEISQTAPQQNQAQATAPTGVAPAPQKTAPPPVVSRQASSETETVIENSLYRIVFTNRGGQVKSWVLKKYTDEKGNPLELVNALASAKYGYPLSLWSYDENLRNKLNSVLYVAASTGSSAPAEITFEYADGDVAVQKRCRFDHSYVVEVKTSVQVKGAEVTAFPMWPSGFGDQSSASTFASSQIAFQYDSKVERLASSWTVLPSIKVIGGNTIPGPFHWAAVSDQYFTAAFIPLDPQNAALVTLRSLLEIPHNPSDPSDKRQDKLDVYGAAVGNLKGATTARLYVGPKALADLESVPVPGITGAEPNLRAIVDFGWLGYIARPLFLWLKWTYNHIVPNWGWAILLQTLIINVALLPLRISNMKYMFRVQKLQPQLKVLQEKYKKYNMRDPRKQEVQKEMWALQQKEGVNPVTGCLPMLIQMPFLFAYYRMLGVAIDLRHASWLWIHDLSAPDPWHVLPIAIILTMFIMQRMTPQGGMDPAQQKMMNIMMPGLMGVMFWNLAAGLCLYFSAGNLIGIAQQLIMNRTALGREIRELAEKRARKKEK